MKRLIKILLIITMTIPTFAQNSFKDNQLKFERVKTAYNEKGTALQKALKREGFNSTFQLFIAAYKTEGKLEIWLKPIGKNQFQLFKTYDFCAHSGIIGPKVFEGDRQTPEGFYHINVFNPQSTYYLSLGLNYPNKVDEARTGKNRSPGNDIYIHGNCVTVGCIPLTDDKIKEVYILATEAKNSGQEDIPVYIFPFKMDDKNLKKYSEKFPAQVPFLLNLQHGYAYFEKYKTLPKISQEDGKYLVK